MQPGGKILLARRIYVNACKSWSILSHLGKKMQAPVGASKVTMNETTPWTMNTSRRSFLKIVPLGILAGVFASIGGAAFRFLRPKLSAATDSWLDVASVSELTGPQPLSRKIVAEHVAGWAITTEEHNVFVLPAKNNQVLSAVCPHEGCEVAWDQNTNRFSCPCHESYFAAGRRAD